jgi:hypothetical protein
MMELKILTWGRQQQQECTAATNAVADGAVLANHRPLDGTTLPNGHTLADDCIRGDLRDKTSAAVAVAYLSFGRHLGCRRDPGALWVLGQAKQRGEIFDDLESEDERALCPNRPGG